LASRLREILGLGREYRVAVIGAGNMGSALVRYRGFDSRGFHIVAVYDSDPAKIGDAWNGVEVRDERRLDADLAHAPFDIAIVVTPAEAAQAIVDRLVGGGVKAILNFAPVQLKVPTDVVVKNVNMALELEALSYGLRHA
jgi:redox-sensing transcriptional repressor